MLFSKLKRIGYQNLYCFVNSKKRFPIGSFRDIQIQLGSEAERTQTMEIEQASLFFLLFVSSQPRYQAVF